MVHEAPVTPCAWPARLVEGGRAHGAGRLRAVRGITPSSLRRARAHARPRGAANRAAAHGSALLLVAPVSLCLTVGTTHDLFSTLSYFVLVNGATGSTDKIQQNQYKKVE